MHIKTPKTTVYRRAGWGDSWTKDDSIQCLDESFCASPRIGQARLTRWYGRGMDPGEDHRAIRSRLAIDGQYVKIVVEPLWGDLVVDEEGAPILDDGGNPTYEDLTGGIPPWIGRIIETLDQQDGTQADPLTGSPYPKGRQNWVARDLSGELDDVDVVSSWVETGTDTAEEIGRAIPFNGGAGLGHDLLAGPRPNRTISPIGGAYCFAQDLATAALWNAAQIIDYLASAFGPVDNSGTQPIPWELDPEADSAYLDSVLPPLRSEGLSLKKVIDSILDRRRGMGWYLRIDEDDEEGEPYFPTRCVIVPFSFAATEIVLTSGARIPANPDQVEIDAGDWTHVETVELRTSQCVTFDQVRFRGCRIGVVLTVSCNSDNLVKDWTTDQEAGYETAASTAAGYAALELYQKQLANDAFRASPAVERVYRWFKLDPAWDGKAAPNDGHAMQYAFCPLSDDGTEHRVDGDASLLGRGPPFLPLSAAAQGMDYSAGTWPASVTFGRQWADEYQPTIVVVRTEDQPSAAGGASGPQYEYADRLAAKADVIELGDAGRDWSLSTRIRQDAPGLELSVSKAGYQHKIAYTDFFPLDVDAQRSPPEIDWQDILATIHLETDQHLEYRWPPDEDFAEFEMAPRRVLTVEVKDARLDYILPDTLVGVLHGQLQYCTAGGILRNDRARLEVLAKAAAAWYCQPRRTLHLKWKGISRLVDLGQMMTAIGCADDRQTTLNTVVTGIEYNFADNTTTVQTEHAELELVFSKPRRGKDKRQAATVNHLERRFCLPCLLTAFTAFTAFRRHTMRTIDAEIAAHRTGQLSGEARAALQEFLASQAQGGRGMQYVLGQTRAEGDDYPTYPASDACATVFPFVLIDATFPEAAGVQALTTYDRSATIHYVFNLAQVFIPVETVLWLFRYDNRWWTYWVL